MGSICGTRDRDEAGAQRIRWETGINIIKVNRNEKIKYKRNEKT